MNGWQPGKGLVDLHRNAGGGGVGFPTRNHVQVRLKDPSIKQVEKCYSIHASKEEVLVPRWKQKILKIENLGVESDYTFFVTIHLDGNRMSKSTTHAETFEEEMHCLDGLNSNI
ncbi:hypothetical protein OIU77_019878 [Salix suchowensis]|uniref:G-patch domain-containing protein n=1 Tax=Salix suchowensis TaxID=1278906 RepID=A0ABQ9CHQ0_9ROSI|nr:hypothetical protein OIU77_019878 [Salix suchowensis]